MSELFPTPTPARARGEDSPWEGENGVSRGSSFPACSVIEVRVGLVAGSRGFGVRCTGRWNRHDPPGCAAAERPCRQKSTDEVLSLSLSYKPADTNLKNGRIKLISARPKLGIGKNKLENQRLQSVSHLLKLISHPNKLETVSFQSDSLRHKLDSVGNRLKPGKNKLKSERNRLVFRRLREESGGWLSSIRSLIGKFAGGR
ncbi:MAG: hypothetical protein HONBIEJF_00435 [Fimbriimonadaceae bacterium]|nr:hypothetical protein [Fimbriimonadaceae bacterium]